MVGKASGARGSARRDTGSRSDWSQGGGPREPSMHALGEREEARTGVQHLGPYAPLIGAIRDELERFVMDELRLHLAIAERDRYVLTSIEVECENGDEHTELLRRFVREFRPEQIKQYLAREVIAGLRNASAVDLAQFAGLNATTPLSGGEDDDGYAALLAELRSASSPDHAPPPYHVTLVGRWSPADAPHADAPTQAPTRPADPAQRVFTPLASHAFSLDIEDAPGARRVEIAAIPGRRYAIGKGEGCEIVVDGIYASRRHCEIWYDEGKWWVVDVGSTNGIRIEPGEASGAGRAASRAGGATQPLELPVGASLVLSARTEGEPREYPRITLGDVAVAHRNAGDENAADATPVTPIAAGHPRNVVLTLSARMASGARQIDIHESALPFSIGRSRNQSLVVDWAHADVSGRHLEIVEADPAGASVVVHGDNGVNVDGTFFETGSTFRWEPGETLRMGGREGASPPCTLTLGRAE
jgi:pSer/pThr/pTyr-binding forkhead associated (FHA) protein